MWAAEIIAEPDPEVDALEPEALLVSIKYEVLASLGAKSLSELTGKV